MKHRPVGHVTDAPAYVSLHATELTMRTRKENRVYILSFLSYKLAVISMEYLLLYVDVSAESFLKQS